MVFEVKEFKEREMRNKFQQAVEEYQCPGCVCGSDIECYQKGESLSCSKHVVGTILLGMGHILLGMPKGFNRVGGNEKLNPSIYGTYESSDWKYNKWNVPVWKYLDKFGNTLVRGMCPRTNFTFLHIFLEDCMDKISCFEITQDDVEGMD